MELHGGRITLLGRGRVSHDVGPFVVLCVELYACDSVRDLCGPSGIVCRMVRLCDDVRIVVHNPDIFPRVVTRCN